MENKVAASSRRYPTPAPPSSAPPAPCEPNPVPIPPPPERQDVAPTFPAPESVSCNPERQDVAPPPAVFFDPYAPITHLAGHLPHWRQPGTTYFVTFRTADSIPRDQLALWQSERTTWLRLHPEPHSADHRHEYHQRFTARIHHWLDQGHGACVLARADLKQVVENALRHFHGQRYQLGEFVVMPNHVHALVTPLEPYELSKILQSWKSYTANQINTALRQAGHFWQKESYDHIVRSPEALETITQYIRDNPRK